jgi:flagellar biosynthesis/type III secretory pathway ATPase
MPAEAFTLSPYFDRLQEADPLPTMGRVVRTVGVLIESRGPHARIGDVCELQAGPDMPALPVEIVGFRDGHLLSVPLGATAGIRPGARVVGRGASATIPVGEGLLGRVLDGLGRPIDGLGPIKRTRTRNSTPRR